MLPKCPHCDGQLTLTADDQKLVVIVCPCCGNDVPVADLLVDSLSESLEGFGAGLLDDDAEFSLELDPAAPTDQAGADDEDDLDDSRIWTMTVILMSYW